MLYQIDTVIKDPEAVVYLANESQDLLAYFLYEQEIRPEVANRIIVFNAQSGYTSENIATCDYLNSTSNLLIVSVRTKQIIESLKFENVRFYNCSIMCDTNNFLFAIGKITTFIPLIDVEASTYRKLSDGREVLQYPVFTNQPLRDESTLVARDLNFPYLFAITDAFKSMITEHQLAIDFHPLPTL